MKKFLKVCVSSLLIVACSFSPNIKVMAHDVVSFDDFYYYSSEQGYKTESIILAVNSPLAYVFNSWYGEPNLLDSANTDVRTILLNDYIYIPTSFIVESFGATSEWVQESATTVIKYNGDTIKLMPNSQPEVIYINGNQVTLRAPIVSLNNRIYLTARDLCDAMGMEVYSKDGVIVIGGEKQVFETAEDEELFVRGWKQGLKYINPLPYASDEEARKDMVSLQIQVWTLNSDGTKSPATRYIDVNKEIVDEVKEVFEELYESPEQFPIKDIGAYSWRGEGSTSSHNWGVAIDINSNENYFVRRVADGEDEILSGSFWTPYENPYSIPADSDVVRIFEKHGWFWAGNGWGDTYDYMHFSLTGR